MRDKREKELKGREGKGHLGGYKLWCKRCHIEYLVDDIPACSRCKKNDDLMTPDERMAELRGKLEEHKAAIHKKKNRRAKWENWKKTQAMFYCKTSTNYNKWDMFESESDPDDKEDEAPIVPKNDP